MAKSGEPNGLKCEVCGNDLTGKQRRACSSLCRSRLGGKDEADRAALARRVAEHEVTKAVQTEVREQAATIVREELTDKVLESIRDLMELLPDAIEALKANLASDDPDIRNKAMGLALRYTMGNASVAPPSLEQTPAPLQVLFAIPEQAGSAVDGTADLVEPEGEEKECMECHAIKPLSQFVGRSDRCKSCHERLEASIEERFGRIDLG